MKSMLSGTETLVLGTVLAAVVGITVGSTAPCRQLLPENPLNLIGCSIRMTELPLQITLGQLFYHS